MEIVLLTSFWIYWQVSAGPHPWSGPGGPQRGRHPLDRREGREGRGDGRRGGQDDGGRLLSPLGSSGRVSAGQF